MLGNDSYACFDTDLLRLAAAWRGELHVADHDGAGVLSTSRSTRTTPIPRVLGKPMRRDRDLSGLVGGGAGVQRSASRRGVSRRRWVAGPIAASAGRWNGLHVVGKDRRCSRTPSASTEIQRADRRASRRTAQVGISADLPHRAGRAADDARRRRRRRRRGVRGGRARRRSRVSGSGARHRHRGRHGRRPAGCAAAGGLQSLRHAAHPGGRAGVDASAW